MSGNDRLGGEIENTGLRERKNFDQNGKRQEQKLRMWRAEQGFFRASEEEKKSDPRLRAESGLDESGRTQT